MIVIMGIFMVGIGLYAFFAPNDWEEGELWRINERTRKSTLHPKIGGPIAVMVGIIALGFGISSSIQESNEATVQRQAQDVSSELSQAFSPIMASLREKAQEANGALLTLTAGERESAGIDETVNVYYAWCNANNVSDGFYMIVQNWEGNDYQNAFPNLIWGGCGGRPMNSPTFDDFRTLQWHQIIPSSFSYEGAIEGTAVGATLTYQETLRAQSLLSVTATPTPEASEISFMELDDLLEQLQDTEFAVRRSAISMVTHDFNVTIPESIVDGLMRDTDERVREFTLEYLQWHRPAKHTDYLIAALDAAELSIRWKAIRHLAQFPNGRAAPRLRELLNEKVEKPAYRHHVIHALGVCDDGYNAPLLFSLVKDPNTANPDTGAALGKVAKPDMIELIIELLESDSPVVVDAAVWALGEGGDPSVVPDLLRCMVTTDDGHLKRTILWALQKLPNRVAIEPLLETAEDQRPYVRWEAISALKSYPEPRVINVLLRYLVDKDASIRATAVNTLKNMPDVTHALLDGLKREKHIRLKHVFVRVLGERGDKKAIPFLESLLAKSNDQFLNAEIHKALDTMKRQ